VFWFDPGRGEYVMHWWDSMGGTAGEYRGQFDGDVLMLSAPMPQGGHSRTSWTLSGPNGHTFLMEVSPDGQVWQPAMEGRYRRGSRQAASKAAKRARPAAAKSRPARRTARAAKPAARSTKKAGASRKRSAKKKRARPR
jgi:hypothetical protein